MTAALAPERHSLEWRALRLLCGANVDAEARYRRKPPESGIFS